MTTKKSDAGKQAAGKRTRAKAAEEPEDDKCPAPEGSFSHALWHAREAAKVTKTEMAERIHPPVKPPVITKIESGRHYVSEKTVQRYAAALGLTFTLSFKKAAKE